MATTMWSCTKENPTPTPTDPVMETGTVLLKFDHVWGPTMGAFSIGQSLVHPMSNEELTFSLLNYYITNVKLTKADGSTYVQPESYHLVRLSSGSFAELVLENIPVGEYTGITYTIGVDSARNVSGIQEGALSPSNGMFWSWNTGYIFVKAEGTSPQSPNGEFKYHLGGFSGEHNAIRTNSHTFVGQLRVLKNAEPSIHFYVNAARFWHGGLRVADLNTVHMPGSNAATLAGNFRDAFVLDHIHN
jgi:hypothetical protein